MKEKLVSIIVPVYNVEKYLNQCMESIVNQTYKNLEILLIDDGSTDKSPIICDGWRNKDKRIKVIHKENEGASAARNYALDIIKGEYVMFVDADDVLNLKIISFLYDLLIENEADIAICQSLGFKDVITDYEEKNEIDEFNNREAINCLNTANKFGLALWAKIYKSELFRDKRLPLVKNSGDNFITYQLLYDAKKIMVSSNQYYYLRNNPLSLTRDVKCFNKYMVKEGIKIIDFVKEKIPSEYENTIYKYLILGIGTYNTMISRKLNDEEYVIFLNNIISTWYKEIKDKIKIPLIRKIEIKLFLYNKKIYKIIFKLFKLFNKG